MDRAHQKSIFLEWETPFKQWDLVTKRWDVSEHLTFKYGHFGCEETGNSTKGPCNLYWS